MMTTLETARDALAAIDGVASCRIGLETGISPADYPLVRIVPDKISPGRPYAGRTATCTIYFGLPIAESEAGESTSGLEEVYRALFALESEILSVIRTLEGRYLETLFDSDRLPTYKLAAIRAELVG